jgi:hypothetical protein
MRASGPQNTAAGAYYVFEWTSLLPFGSTTPPTQASVTAPANQEVPAFPSADAIFPTNFVLPIQPLQGVTTYPPNSVNINNPPPGTNTANTLWCWLYLRRPANPFDTRPYQYREMVTVDAIRFPLTWGDGTGTPGTAPNKDTATPGLAKIFSMQRLQPYRGGHLVPPLPGTDGKGAGANNPVPGTCWGYSEQTMNGGTIMNVHFGNSTQFLVNGGIQHSFANGDGSNKPTTDVSWDYFPFHDRDFTGVAELLLVPGCPPGLFTKQFVENNNPWDGNDTTGPDSDLQPIRPAPNNGYASSAPVGVLTTTMKDARAFLVNESQTYPYLVDKFYYTAASVAPPVINPAPTPLPKYPTYPSASAGFSGGDWTGDGWYKMLEFVEVPSSANGAIGPVALGVNFDWLRQDLKPGLLNLNLIIDEEVFFGLMDDLRLNDSLNASLQATNATATLPRVVTQIDRFGYPVVNPAGPGAGFNGFHQISDVVTLNPTLNPALFAGQIGRGYTYFDPTGNENHGIKAAFADFLKLRAGGSGFLFAWGSGTTGSGPVQVINTVTGLGVTPPAAYPPWVTGLTNTGPGTGAQPGLLAFNGNGWVTQGTPVARERPFRSFSAPNIDDTILRPATLPPSSMTFPGNAQIPALLAANNPNIVLNTLAPPYFFADAAGDPALVAGGGIVTPANPDPVTGKKTLFVMDPGIRNPFMTQPSLYNTGTPTADYGNYSKLPPLIPPRRLFQIPDNSNGNNPPAVGEHFISGASEYPFSPANENPGPPFDYMPNQPIFHEQLFNPTSNLITQSRGITPPGSTTFPNVQPVNQYLGAGLTGTTNTDNRQHPFFRAQLLQKVMNLTTVRTHQFAVWITIGFFEVLKQGSPSLGAPDVLGGEIGLAAGRNIRYRSFFLLDRTRAVGFDPVQPGDFRNVVTYRRRIE